MLSNTVKEVYQHLLTLGIQVSICSTLGRHIDLSAEVTDTNVTEQKVPQNKGMSLLTVAV